jgi:peptidoglycan/LPS O-acetylase OafA/YrhL
MFLGLCLGALFMGRMRRALTASSTVLAGAVMVLVVSVVQTLLDHGDNPRFLVPLQMVVVMVVVLSIEADWSGRSARGGSAGA